MAAHSSVLAMDVSLSELWELARDREAWWEAWWAAVYGVAQSRIPRLSEAPREVP